MKLTNALPLLGLLAAFAVSACSATEYVHVMPECTVPPHPVLPNIDKGGFWDVAGDGLYRQVETYINALWAAYDERQAMVEELCDG